MVAYSFQKRFIEPILSGTKRQTVRRIGARRPAKPGEELQLYSGLRTKQCRLIARARCADVSPVQIVFGCLDLDERDMVFVDGISCLINDFARDDGFSCWAELREFWAKHHPDVSTDFEGLRIAWDTLTPA
jgi:hypothetical protein